MKPNLEDDFIIGWDLGEEGRRGALTIVRIHSKAGYAEGKGIVLNVACETILSERGTRGVISLKALLAEFEQKRKDGATDGKSEMQEMRKNH